MKRKINTIKGKRLVMGGGTNNLTKDEILVTETPNGIGLKERSSDGSIKELAGSTSEGKSYYYLFFPDECPVDIIETINVSVMPITSVLIQLIGSDIHNTKGVVKTNLSFVTSASKDTLVNNAIIGFSVKDEPSFRIFLTPRGYNYETTEGTLYDRTFSKNGGDFVDDIVTHDYIEAIRAMAENCEVTKEEYEAMLNY